MPGWISTLMTTPGAVVSARALAWEIAGETAGAMVPTATAMAMARDIIEVQPGQAVHLPGAAARNGVVTEHPGKAAPGMMVHGIVAHGIVVPGIVVPGTKKVHVGVTEAVRAGVMVRAGEAMDLV